MSEVLHCPTCGKRAHRGDFLCTACETILDAGPLLDEPAPPRESTLVRALLSPPEATLKKKIPQAPPALRAPAVTLRGTTKTRLFTLPFAPTDVPVVALGLDLKAKSLSSFEAFVVSQVDGWSTLEQLRQITSLSKIEIQSVFRSLVERSVVQFKAPSPPPLPKRPAPASKREEPAPAVITEPFNLPAPRRQPAPAPVPPKLPSLANAPTAPRGFPAIAARRTPEHVYEAPLQKAIRLELEGKVAEAIAVLERAIAVSPDPAPLYNRLALALIKERRDLVRAEAMLEKAIEHDPQNDAYSRNLMKVLGMAGSLTGKKKRPRR